MVSNERPLDPAPTSPRPRSLGLAIGAAAGSLAVVAASFVLWSSTGPDDTHITYWAARSLLTSGRIVNVNGHAIEQSSSLADVLLIALLEALTGLPTPDVGVAVSVLGAVVAVVLAGALARRVAPRFADVAPLVVGTTPWLLAWTFGGLETTCAAAAQVAVVLTAADVVERPSWRSHARAALAFALAVTVRPEGPFVLAATLAGGVALGALVAARESRAAAVRAALRYAPLLGLAVAISAVLFAYRRIVFGLWMPNPVYSKVTGLHLERGLVYLAESVGLSCAWMLVGLGAAAHAAFFRGAAPARAATPSASLALAVSGTVAGLGFAIAVGGDWMFGGRFVAPIAPLLVPAALAGAELLVARWRQLAPAIAAGALAMNGVAVGIDKSSQEKQTSYPGDPPWKAAAEARVVTRDFPDASYTWFERISAKRRRELYLGEALKRVTAALAPVGRPLHVASRQAGFVPYQLAVTRPGSVRFYDMYNLVTDDFRRCAPALNGPEQPFRPRTGFSHVSGISYKVLFDEAAVFAACGIPQPDVVFDIIGKFSRAAPALMKAHGYEVVYEQVRPLEGKPDNLEGYIAVKADVARAFGLKYERRVRADVGGGE